MKMETVAMQEGPCFAIFDERMRAEIDDGPVPEGALSARDRPMAAPDRGGAACSRPRAPSVPKLDSAAPAKTRAPQVQAKGG